MPLGEEVKEKAIRPRSPGVNAYHIRFEVCACIVGADHFLLNRGIAHIEHLSYKMSIY